LKIKTGGMPRTGISAGSIGSRSRITPFLLSLLLEGACGGRFMVLEAGPGDCCYGRGAAFAGADALLRGRGGGWGSRWNEPGSPACWSRLWPGRFVPLNGSSRSGRRSCVLAPARTMGLVGLECRMSREEQMPKSAERGQKKGEARQGVLGGAATFAHGILARKKRSGWGKVTGSGFGS